MPITAGLPQLASPIGDPSFGAVVWVRTDGTGVGRGDTQVPPLPQSSSSADWLTDPNRANHTKSTHFMLCSASEDVGKRKLRIDTYQIDARATWLPNWKRPQPPPLAGATSRENFRARTAVANPASQQDREPTGSLTSTRSPFRGWRETSALPLPSLGAGSPSLPVCAPLIKSVSHSGPPSISLNPSMPEEKIPTSTSIGHATPCQRGPGSRPR